LHCLWEGPLSRDGYGRFSLFGSSMGAHRAAWHLSRRACLLPDSVVDHLCNIPRCVNPRHLKAVNQAENIGRSVAEGRHSSQRFISGLRT
jgi:hypothetical protein